MHFLRAETCRPRTESVHAERFAGADGVDTSIRRGWCEPHAPKRVVDGVEPVEGTLAESVETLFELYCLRDADVSSVL